MKKHIKIFIDLKNVAIYRTHGEPKVIGAEKNCYEIEVSNDSLDVVITLKDGVKKCYCGFKYIYTYKK